MEKSDSATRLSESQRYHLDAYGYVLLRGVLSEMEIEAIRTALSRLSRDPDRGSKRVYVNQDRPHILHVGNLVEFDPALLHYAAHPRLIPLVEQAVGGKVRLEESEAIINRRDPGQVFSEGVRTVPTGFHTGSDHGWSTYEAAGRFHCLFVKTLAYLTDVGPEDGGTAVIPGSHKMGWKQEEMVRAAHEDPSLIVQMEARAGDVLLFPETLIHSTTAIRSDRERMIIVSGYTPTILKEWPGNEVSSEFVNSLPAELRPLIGGTESWPWKRNQSS